MRRGSREGRHVTKRYTCIQLSGQRRACGNGRVRAVAEAPTQSVGRSHFFGYSEVCSHNPVR